MASNYRKANVKRLKPGYKATAYIAALSWFTTLAEPDPAGTGAAKFTITDDHAFASLKGFVEVTLVKKKNTATAETKGDVGAQWLNHKVSIVIPGDGPEIQALITELMNEELVILQKEADCDGVEAVIQLGCNCSSATPSSVKFDAGTEMGDTGKSWTLEAETYCRYFYEGTITIQA